MNERLKRLWAKADLAFYQWERLTDQQDLSDDDRLQWCQGYIQALVDLEDSEEHEHVGEGWSVQTYQDNYLYIRKAGKPGEIQLKADDDGYAIDVYENNNAETGNDPVATTYATYHECLAQPAIDVG